MRQVDLRRKCYEPALVRANRQRSLLIGFKCVNFSTETRFRLLTLSRLHHACPIRTSSAFAAAKVIV